MRYRSLILPPLAATLMVFSLGACGKRGPLFLPPQQDATPLSKTPSTMPPASPEPVQDNPSTRQESVK
ncbi:MAG: lipoprotein [Candidatus Accumulibacter sp.]|nr:lipoprotein [Accumulibacter sp.]